MNKIAIPVRWPFITGHEDIPIDLLPSQCEWQPADVIAEDEQSDTGYVTRRDAVRNSKEIMLNDDTLPELYKWADNVAEQYFSKWVDAYGESLPCKEIRRSRNISLIQYDPGHFFSRHTDFGSWHDKWHRVVMIAIGVSRQEDYTGGNLMFPKLGIQFKLDRGDVVVFPAILEHEVSILTSGTRTIMLPQGNVQMTNEQVDVYSDFFTYESLNHDQHIAKRIYPSVQTDFNGPKEQPIQ